MVNVKPVSESTSNYGASGGRASTNYKASIARVSDWQAKATSPQAKSNYEAGVAGAISADRRGKALAAVSNSDWQSRALNKGGSQIGSAISMSSDKWAKGFTPYASTLSSVQLPPRTTDGMSNLTNRAGAIVSALQAKKKEIKG